MTCPLDGFPTPDCAYGMHRLLSSWGGDLVRVQSIDAGQQADLMIDTDQWTTIAEIESLAASWGTEVYVRDIYDETGNGRTAHSNAESTGARPPVLTSGGVAYRMTLDGVERPCIFRRAETACNLAMAGGNYAPDPPGKRFLLHSVIGQIATDPQHASVGSAPGGSLLLCSSYSGGGSDAAIVEYGGGLVPNGASAPSVLFDNGSVANLGSSWLTGQVHIVSVRRDTNTTLQPFRNGVNEGPLAFANVARSTTDPAFLFNTANSTGLPCDSYRCTEIVHWQSDPGDIGAALYAATVAAFTSVTSTVTGTAHVSLRPRVNLPPARVGAQHLSPSAARFLTGKRGR